MKNRRRSTQMRWVGPSASLTRRKWKPENNPEPLKPTIGEVNYGNDVLLRAFGDGDFTVEATVEAVATNGDILVRFGDKIIIEKASRWHTDNSLLQNLTLRWVTLDDLKFVSLRRKRTKWHEQQDYQDKLKAIELRNEGLLTKKEVGKLLGRGETWVKKHWNLHPNLLKVPDQLHHFRRQAWMDFQYRRGYAPKGLYETILKKSSWHKKGSSQKKIYGHNQWRNVAVHQCPDCTFLMKPDDPPPRIYLHSLDNLLKRDDLKILREQRRLKRCKICGQPSYNKEEPKDEPTPTETNEESTRIMIGEQRANKSNLPADTATETKQGGGNRKLSNQRRYQTWEWEGKIVNFCPRCKCCFCDKCHKEKCPKLIRGGDWATYQKGLIPQLDELVERIREEYKLPGKPRPWSHKRRGSHPGEDEFSVGLNHYPNGKCIIAKHRHDSWTIVASFGAPRIFSVDYQETLMEDGDLAVIGTQKHAVPEMDWIKEGRISLIIMWTPREYHLSGRWRK